MQTKQTIYWGKSSYTNLKLERLAWFQNLSIDKIKTIVKISKYSLNQLSFVNYVKNNTRYWESKQNEANFYDTRKCPLIPEDSEINNYSFFKLNNVYPLSFLVKPFSTVLSIIY